LPPSLLHYFPPFRFGLPFTSYFSFVLGLFFNVQVLSSLKPCRTGSPKEAQSSVDNPALLSQFPTTYFISFFAFCKTWLSSLRLILHEQERGTYVFLGRQWCLSFSYIIR
jgi:hypothetical protein